MSGPIAAIGTAIHNGWVVLVCVAVRKGTFSVTDRRRVELVAADLPSQPHHHEALEMELPDAEVLIGSVRESACEHMRAALSELRGERKGAHEPGVIGLPEARPFPSTIGEILESHPATLIADAEMYRATLEEAAEALGFGVVLYPRRSELDEAARALEVDAARLGELLTGMGRELGPPWRKDHRIAAASAIAALGEDGGLAGALA